jgi:thiol-disulfide isomerase/thioredoxin
MPRRAALPPPRAAAPSRRVALRLGAVATAGVLVRPLTVDALPAGVQAGAPAPELAARTDAGPVSLADWRGRVVWLDFWASWCAPCRQSFPWMDAMQARYGERGLQVVAINVDARPEPARRFLADTPARFVVAFDAAGETPRRYAIRAMPTSVLIGADGTVLATHSGFRDTDREPLEATLRAALDARAAARQGGAR